MARCRDHGGHDASGTCRRCLGDYCPECLVYSHGRSKQPYCLRCAVDVATSARATGAEQIAS